ncbi:hypothetical protein FQA39_LY19342 [Lamprigera yunnana]|nr:hypothetical protein FQA39_LY19342 [Lamprigera yunnana]
MARKGADMTGIDLATKALRVAQLHALEAQTPHITYQEIAVEALAMQQPQSFDTVTCMEMLEHVPDPASVVKACMNLVKPVLANIVVAERARGVVTNKSKRFTEPLSQQIDLFATAGAVISGDTTRNAKPHPEPLLEAARRIGVAPEDCVYVGDDERDIIAGKAAGMHTVAAVYGYLGEKQSVAHWQADDVIDSPRELLKRLKLA